MKLALRNALILVAALAVVPTTGCSKLFKKTVIPSGSGTPIPSSPPLQAACVQGLSAQSNHRNAQAITPAVLTVDSNPRGLKVEVNGAYTGSTPQSTTPPYSDSMNQITVLNQNGGTDYQACYSQAGNANLTVFYNRSVDTFGKITTIQDAARSASSAFAASSALRRSYSAAQTTGSDYSGSAIEVRYRRGQTHMLRAGTDIAPADAPFAIRVVHAKEGESIGAAIETLKAQSGVVSAEPVQLRYLKTRPPIATPNDPHFSATEQWDMYQIQALSGWAYTLGAPTIKIAVVDTGLDTAVANTMVQADLIPKLDVTESVITGGANCSGTQVVTPGQAAVQDADGHGTNVAGIAAATGNNAAGFAGMAWNVKLQVYRIFTPSGNACTSDEAKAIMDAVANGARVINLSLGSSQAGGPDQAERDAINYATSHNVLVVAAAGNERSQGVQNVDFPGAYPGVLAVGATSLNDGNTGNPSGAKEYVASYSNAGPNLGIVAPGGDPNGAADSDVLHWISNLYSTTGAPPCTNPANCYVLIAGTSQATPHVAGAAALLLSANPNLTPAQLIKVLEGTADDIGDKNQGFGRLNIYRALAAVTGDASPPVYKPASGQFVAFAYTNSGAVNAAPAIADMTFPGGILVNPDGSFRIADIPTGVASFKIGVWYDANGNGVVDAGDRFAASGLCSQTGPCSGAANLSVTAVTSASFALP